MNRVARSRQSVGALFLLICLADAVSSCAQKPMPPVEMPDWAKGAVWYQIFPERFRNGDSRNDPTRAEVLGTEPADWQVSPWTSDWYALQPWEREHSAKFYDNVFRRRYGGDLVGVIDKLDYLAELGVTAIYFNPIFEAISLHKYDASSYHHIDNNFGRNSAGDALLMQTERNDTTAWRWSSADSVFLDLLQKAHARGIHVIIDGVFNHVGRDFWAFQDVLKNQRQSQYADWFIIHKWDDPATPEDELRYASWWNSWTLPEFREDAHGLVAGPKKYIWAITKRWMDPNGDGNPEDGIDGWRLDVAKDVSPEFWRQWCTYVRTLNPNAYLTAEIWEEAQDWISDEMFHSVMNYPFAYATLRFFADTGAARLEPSAFKAAVTRLLTVYPNDVTLGLMNLVDSHDTDRIGSMLRNPNRDYDQHAGLRDNPNYDVTKPTAANLQIQKMIAAFQCAFPGAPMIYYGDEAGMWGADDPDDRKPMVWPELTYADETYASIGLQHGPDPVVFDHDLHTAYRAIFALRKQHPALVTGAYTPLLADDAVGVFGFMRVAGADTVLAYFNIETKTQRVQAPVLGDGWHDALGNGAVTPGVAGQELALPAKTAAILVRSR